MKFVQYLGEDAPPTLSGDTWHVLPAARETPFDADEVVERPTEADVILIDVEVESAHDVVSGYRAQKPDLPRVVLRDAGAPYDLEVARLAKVYAARSRHELRTDWLLRSAAGLSPLAGAAEAVGDRVLPLLPDASRALLEALAAPGLELAEAVSLVAAREDVAQRVLALANSAFYSLPCRVSDLEFAAEALGLPKFRRTVLGVLVFDVFDELLDDERRACAKRIRDMSVLRMCVADILSDGRDHELSSAALLMDVGRLTLLAWQREPVVGLFPTTEQLDGEAAASGIDSGLLSAVVLQSWGWPDEFANAVASAFWDSPHPGFGELSHMLRISSALAAEGLGGSAPLSLEWMQGLGVLHEFFDWREMVADMAMAWPGA